MIDANRDFMIQMEGVICYKLCSHSFFGKFFRYIVVDPGKKKGGFSGKVSFLEKTHLPTWGVLLLR